MTYTSPTYEFLVRDARSLEFLGELRPDDVIATWTRRDIEAGFFRITIAREHAPLPLIALHNLIEIRRNTGDGSGPQQEFVGSSRRARSTRSPAAGRSRDSTCSASGSANAWWAAPAQSPSLGRLRRR